MLVQFMPFVVAGGPVTGNLAGSRGYDTQLSSGTARTSRLPWHDGRFHASDPCHHNPRQRLAPAQGALVIFLVPNVATL